MLNDLSPIHIVIFLSLSGIVLRSSLSLVGQNWVKTYHFLGTFILLPNIAYIITTVIAGDIALSLGMIGALSIVRFRHPVKSALELIMYFDLITIGIATSVRTKWAIQLVLVSIIIIFAVKYIQIFSKKFGKSFYTTSFNEGYSVNTMEIIATEKLEKVEESEFLKNITNDKINNEIAYRLSFESVGQINNFKKEIENLKNIKKINIDIV